MDDAAILPDFHGIIVHDCWGSYWKYRDAVHAVCCAHLLRELTGVEENHPEQIWAAKFKELLLAMKKVKDKALAAGKDEVSYYHLHKFDKQYDEILKTAYEENPLPEPVAKSGVGRKKQGIKFNLQTEELQGIRLPIYKESLCAV